MRKANTSRFSKIKNKPLHKAYRPFLREDGTQKNWFTVFTVLVPILLAVWGIFISLDNSDNKEQINRLIESNEYLRKIYAVTDSTSKSTLALRELPGTITDLNTTLYILNSTLKKQIIGLESSYSSLNASYDRINKLAELTNEQIVLLGKNNKMINDEFARRPKIIVYGKIKENNGQYFVNEFVVQNAGDLEFKFVKFHIQISSNCIELDTAKIVYDLWERKSKNIYVYYVFTESQPQIIGGTSLPIPINKRFVFNSKNVKIKYGMDYLSKYESKTITGDVIIK
jgi:hypothetical protein